MRAVVQRVRSASVTVDGAVVGVLDRPGLLVYVGVTHGDGPAEIAWLARKVASFGVRLQAGHVILPGSCTRAIDARPGDVFRADFGPLGPVSLTFEGAA